MGYGAILRSMIDRREETLLGFLDYHFMPFALGDTMTWLMNLQVEAARRRLKRIVQLVHADPQRHFYRAQPHINRNNYREILTNLFPAFLCSPMIDAIHVVEENHTYWAMLITSAMGGAQMWPGMVSQFCQSIDFYSHKRINRYFETNADLPLLCAPRGYVQPAAAFRRRYLGGRFVVTVNIRQRASTLDTAATHRDSPLDAWMTFFDRVSRGYRDVVFVILGGYTELDRHLFRSENVVIPRTFGYSLGTDLALLFDSDLFMGTSSGFAAAATFSAVPYVITNFESRAASFVGIPVGTPHYPFAKLCQTLSWERESSDLLMDLFEAAYAVLKIRQSTTVNPRAIHSISRKVESRFLPTSKQ